MESQASVGTKSNTNLRIKTDLAKLWRKAYRRPKPKSSRTLLVAQDDWRRDNKLFLHTVTNPFFITVFNGDQIYSLGKVCH